jgi:hypothetical protein
MFGDAAKILLGSRSKRRSKVRVNGAVRRYMDYTEEKLEKIFYEENRFTRGTRESALYA